jgi:hypothetical protein
MGGEAGLRGNGPGLEFLAGTPTGERSLGGRANVEADCRR